MSRIRLTRQDSRKQTRQHLLEAAAKVIVHRGLAATTVEEIVAKAGYTRGAFYSNFRGKLELFNELLHTAHAEIKRGLQHLLDASLRNGDMDHAGPSFAASCDHLERPLMLWAEARHHALRDMAFRHYLNALALELRDVIACYIDDFCRRTRAQPSITCSELALAVMTLMESILSLRTIMPTEASGESLHAILYRFFAAAVYADETPHPCHDANTAAS